MNQLGAMVDKKTGEVIPETPITDINSDIYTSSDGSVKSPPFTIEVFEEVGRAFCMGLLDYIEKNPYSRLPQTSYKTLDAVK